ncbi:MAG: 4Fe-4S dicluster domain-containing protein [Chloroflexi bacterium]|nr:4Fe-4S dicluster domain-containing protein [Chloroflexota bacterium]
MANPEKATVVAADKVVFYYRWCKKCNLCQALCPREALALDEEGHPYLAYPERCNSCGMCEVWCPDFAITVPDRHNPS